MHFYHWLTWLFCANTTKLFPSRYQEFFKCSSYFLRTGYFLRVDFEFLLPAIEANLVRSTWRVSDKPCISVKCGLSPSKSPQNYPHVTKILQNFWLSQVKHCLYKIIMESYIRICKCWGGAFVILTYVCCIGIHRFIQKDNDTIIETREDFFKKYITHFICNVCVWVGVGDRT